MVTSDKELRETLHNTDNNNGWWAVESEQLQRGHQTEEYVFVVEGDLTAELKCCILLRQILFACSVYSPHR
jgi:hypothetical protein